MSGNAQDYDFDKYDKPGAERSRRRRGEDDDLESDFEEDLLEEDWTSGKKNPSEMSDEELNDDLLQSDDEDVNISGQDVSLNATYSLVTSFDQQDNLQEGDYTDDVVNLGADGYEEGDVEEEGYQQEGEEEYTEEYSQDNIAGMPEDQMDYTAELAEGEDGCQDEVLDIEISEPIDGEFQDDEYQTSYDDEPVDEHGVHREDRPEEHVGEEEQQEQQEEHTAEGSQVFDTGEFENEAGAEEETKEESDEEDEEDEESGRIRFKSERRDSAVVRLADACSKRRNIPETLELSEKAKQDLMQFEAQEQQKRQNRFGGRGRGGGGRGNRGRGGFGMADFRGHRGRINDQRLPLMGNMGVQQQSSRMPSPRQPHQQQLQSQQHHPSRPRGPLPFQGHGRPATQQPLQPLIPPHMTHRSPPLRPQMEPPPRMMSSPPPNFPQHHQQTAQQPKNIHINPHFRGPTSSSVQVPLMPPVQSQPRPAVGPQRFPGPGDFQQHMPGNFGQPQRHPHLMEPFRNQPPQGPQDREPLFMSERPESTRFPGQHMFDHQGPSPLMNNSNNIHQQQQLPGQCHMGFNPPGPAFSQQGQGPLGLFPREPPRPNLPPHQGHQGMVNLNQQGGPPNQPRPFMGPRQPFGQQGNLFPPPQVQFGMQNLMHGPPISHNTMPSHQPMHHQQQQQHHHHQQHQHQHHHHRQELPHHQQQQLHFNEPRPMMHHSEIPFHQQQAHGSPRHMSPRPQNPQQLNMSNRQRMNTPVSKQMQHRNSNLRELPVAPGNASMNSGRSAITPTSPSANVRPVARTTQEVRPRQNMQPIPGIGRGRGQVSAKPQLQPGETGRTVVQKEIPSKLPSTAPQEPDEDDETRQYRLKIEEQKRLREEILRRKELRRQMQAGVRKKELLERLNSNTPSQNPAPAQAQPVQQNQQMPHPLQQQQQPPPPSQQQQLQQQPPPQQQQAEQKQQQQSQTQPQRQFPQRTQQSVNQAFKQGPPIPTNSNPQTPIPNQNVKARLQMVKGNIQQQQTPVPGQELQWNQPQENQQHLQQQLQRRNSTLHNMNRPGTQIQSTQKNAPMTPSMGPSQALLQNQGPKPGAKRTVMQRTRTPAAEGQQVPQKVRVVKLSGSSGKMAETTGSPVQQQGTCPVTPLIQGIQRKVTMTGPPQQGPAATLQSGRGGMENPHQNRVVVSGRGRGRGVGQMGRGRPMATRQSQRGAENVCCTVSIEGLSSSTSEVQLQNLLRSIGPIEMFKMMPQQRKAIAKFSSPQHAASFQMSFHRSALTQQNLRQSSVLLSTSKAKLRNRTKSLATAGGAWDHFQ